MRNEIAGWDVVKRVGSMHVDLLTDSRSFRGWAVARNDAGQYRVLRDDEEMIGPTFATEEEAWEWLDLQGREDITP